MPALSAAATIDLWERGAGLDPIPRALVLAAAGGAPAEAERLPLGERDRSVLRLRAGLLGRTLAATAPCPECAEQVEFALDAEALLEREPAELTVAGPNREALSWRSPDSADLAAASAAGSPQEAEEVLLRRCVDSAPQPLPEGLRRGVCEAMAAADPLAEVLVDLRCPACGASFVADLELAEFVWQEVRARAQHLLREVDALAREYGWTEQDVLALSDERRAFYLGLAGRGR